MWWCWWDSWGGPGWGRVQICHKGPPGRDRPRRKARNINDSSRAPRPDRGLCGRFGQPAPPQTSGRGATSQPAAGASAPSAETCTSHSKVQFQPSFSRAKCTSRRGRGQPQPSRTTATTPRSTTTPASRPPLLVRKAHPAIPRARETGVSRSAPPRVLPHHCADPGQP